MSDRRDPRIRALIVELSESSPEAPTFAEIEDCAAEPVATGAVRPLVAARPRRGWAFGVAAAAAVVALLLIGGPLALLRDTADTEIEPLTPVIVDTTVTTPPTTVPPTTQTTLGAVPPGVVWTGPIDPITLTLDPSVVPAEIGTVTVTVTGQSPDDVWVAVCAGARGVVNPENWPGFDAWTGEMAAVCGEGVFREAGTLVNPKIEDGAFTATLRVPIDAQAIRDGGVVITTGDIFVPLRGNALLRITDDTAAVNTAQRTDRVADVAITADGTMYALTGDGIAVWDTDSLAFSKMLPLTGLPGGDDPTNPSVDIDHIEVTGDGTLWAAGLADAPLEGQDSLHTGAWIKRFDGAEWSDAMSERYGRELSPPDLGQVTDLAAGPLDWARSEGESEQTVYEAGGSVWATTGEHLVFFDGDEWWDYTTPGWSRSVSVGAGGEAWIGTSTGQGPWRFHGGVFPWQRQFRDVADIPSMFTHQVAVTDSGAVWMATQDGTGIISLNQGAYLLFTTADGLLSNWGSVVTGPGDAVAVVHADGVSRLVDGAWESAVLDLPDVKGAQAVIDSNGVLWIPTVSGVVRLEGTEATTLIAPDSDQP